MFNIIYNLDSEGSEPESDKKKSKLFSDDNSEWLKPKNKKDLFENEDESDNDMAVS